MSKSAIVRAALLMLAVLGVSSHEADAAVGRTKATFNVSATGAATYTIPIWVPPGPRGVQPSLALVYNSNSGNGSVGVGWSLAGLSAITRCNKTFAQDGAPSAVTLTYNDAFCLDGKRLRLTSSENLATYGQDGTTYQSEITDFSNVTAHGVAGNGPAYFTVRGKDGLTYEYGNGGNSQVLASGASTASAWMLDKVTDRANNTMVITYLAPSATLTGTTVPASISWTPSSAGASAYNYTVQFAYTNNVPQSSISGYVAGTAVVNQDLLLNIQIQSAGATVRQYVLNYDTSLTTGGNRLVKVTECADAAATNCLLPTTITYQPGSKGLSTSATNAVTGAWSLYQHYDLNGDGFPDLVYNDLNFSTTYVAFGSASGYGAPINTGINPGGYPTLLFADLLGTGTDGIIANNGGTLWYYTWNGSSFAGVSMGVAASGVVALTDVNGDGLPDIVISSGATVSGSFQWHLKTQFNTSSNGAVSFSTTVNDKLVWSCGCSVNLSTPQGSGSLRAWDFNGDGREDLVMVTNTRGGQSIAQLISDGTNFTPVFVASSSSPPPAPIGVDWNSDHCTDLAWGNALYVSGCNGSPPASIYAGGQILTSLDWDSDGRTDLIIANGSTIGAFVSNGDGTGTLQSTSIPYSYSNCTYFSFDADGDGQGDLGCESPGGTSTYYLHTSVASLPDRVSSITDGYGNSVSPTYAVTTRGSYSNTLGASYPSQRVTQPFYVVSQATLSDGVGGTYTQTYSYSDARRDLQGRGFQGFTFRTNTDSRNGLITKQTFQTNFPYTGFVSQQDVFQSNGTTLISHDSISPFVTLLDTTTNNQRDFLGISSATHQRYEVGGPKNGQLITTAATSYSYDNYGNATTVNSTVTDNDSTSLYAGQQWTTATNNTITPDAGPNWCLGLSTQITVTNTAPGTPTIARTQQFTPDYVNCRITDEITEPSSASYKVTRHFDFDSFGNVSATTVTGINMSARVTSVNWGTTGQFPMSVTNPLNQTTQAGYDFNLGVQTSQTDPNLIATSWTYDAFGRKTQETRPDGTYTVWTYNDCANWGGCLIGAHSLALAHYAYNTDGSVQTDGTTYYDQFDRPLLDNKRMLAGGYDRNEVRYDSLGRVQQRAMPCTWSAVGTACPYWTTFGYDAVNRETSESRPINAGNLTAQTTSISYQGRTTVVTDPQGKTTTKIVTVAGTLGRSQDHNGYYQSFGYDAFGSVTSVTDSLSNTLFSASYGYGIAPFQTATTDMDRGTWGYTPNALGEVVAYSDANGNAFNMTYDALSRPLTRAATGESTTTWTWGASAASYNIGQLQSLTSTNGPTETYAYDSKGRLTNHSIAADTTYSIDYSYSGTTGQLDILTYPTSTAGYRLKLQYVYQNGFLTQVKDYNAGTAFWSANAANSRGQITQETLGNGLVSNHSFDPITGWLNYIQCGAGGGTCSQNQSYLYDLVGNVTQRQNNNLGLTENFYYDNLYRLSYSQLNGSTNLSLSYDAMGNITSKSDVAGGATWTYNASKKHAVVQAGSSNFTYSYDANGNAMTRNGNAITWSKYNYPTVINGSSGESTTLYYNANQERWKQVYTNGTVTETTIYVAKLLEKVTANSVDDYRHYIYANGQSIAIMSRTTAGANVTRYVLRDNESGISKIADSNGASVVSESFTVFGARRNPATWSGVPTNGDQVTSASITRQGYTGQDALGAMGLNHMNGRVEDAITGRFLSADPFVHEPANTQNYNRYSYVNNNPMTLVDPSGFEDQLALQHTEDHSMTLSDFATGNGSMLSACYGDCSGARGWWGNSINLGSGEMGHENSMSEHLDTQGNGHISDFSDASNAGTSGLNEVVVSAVRQGVSPPITFQYVGLVNGTSPSLLGDVDARHQPGKRAGNSAIGTVEVTARRISANEQISNSIPGGAFVSTAAVLNEWFESAAHHLGDKFGIKISKRFGRALPGIGIGIDYIDFSQADTPQKQTTAVINGGIDVGLLGITVFNPRVGLTLDVADIVISTFGVRDEAVESLATFLREP